jgi:hypothetical protein
LGANLHEKKPHQDLATLVNAGLCPSHIKIPKTGSGMKTESKNENSQFRGYENSASVLYLFTWVPCTTGAAPLGGAGAAFVGQKRGEDVAIFCLI